MKTIKFIIALTLVSVIAISCKETKKEEAETPAVEVVEESVVLEDDAVVEEEVVEVAVDSTTAVIKEEVEKEVEQ